MSAITTSNGSFTKYSGPNAFKVPIQDNGDGTFSEVGASNQDLTALVLTAQGAATKTADLYNLSGRGVKVVIDITAQPSGSPTLTVTIQGFDPTSGKYYDLLASTALASIATTTMTVYPGAATSSNVSANDVVPRRFRIKAVIGGTSTPTVTATIGVCVIS